MDNAFTYAETHPIVTEAEYPYKGRRTSQSSCSSFAQTGKVTVQSFHDVQQNSISQMKAALDKSPVSVAIEADQYVFQGYQSGVITSPPAEPNLTTVSSPSDMVPSMEKTSSSSRTPGDHHGVTKVTLESEPTTSAVSCKLPRTQSPTDLVI